MGATLKYVKDFEFPAGFGFKGSAGQTVVKGYCRGGDVKMAKGGKVDAKAAVHKHGKHLHPGQTETKLARGGGVKHPKGLKMPSALRRGVPVAPAGALIEPASATGLPPSVMPQGLKKGGQLKVAKVMNEFSSGKLHSGSKKGPVVENRKQAIAIGLSEARKASKK